MGFVLGIDLGTTWSAAAVVVDGTARPLTLAGRGFAAPSVVARDGDGFVVGEAAQRRLRVAPSSGAREVKRRLGDAAPFVLDGAPFGAEALLGRIMAYVVELATGELGEAPELIVLSHPATWGEYKLDLLREAGKAAGVTSLSLVTEPVAAAVHYTELGRVAVGDVVAVYDFGGGTFDAAVLRRTGTGFEPLGEPQGLDRLGGIDIDHAVFAHVDHSLDGALSGADRSDPDVAAALARVREECTAAKEALSDDGEVAIPVNIPGLATQVRLTRNELESMVRPRLDETAAALEAAVASAQLQMDDVGSILLVGGTARMPVVAEFVASRWGRPTATDAHPKLAVALGAAAHGWRLIQIAGSAHGADEGEPDDDRSTAADALAAAVLAAEHRGGDGLATAPVAPGAAARASTATHPTPTHAVAPSPDAAPDGGGMGGRMAAAAVATGVTAAGVGVGAAFVLRDDGDSSADDSADQSSVPTDPGDDGDGDTDADIDVEGAVLGGTGTATAGTPAARVTPGSTAGADTPTTEPAAGRVGVDTGPSDAPATTLAPPLGAPPLDVLDVLVPPADARAGQPTGDRAPTHDSGAIPRDASADDRPPSGDRHPPSGRGVPAPDGAAAPTTADSRVDRGADPTPTPAPQPAGDVDGDAGQPSHHDAGDADVPTRGPAADRPQGGRPQAADGSAPVTASSTAPPMPPAASGDPGTTAAAGRHADPAPDDAPDRTEPDDAAPATTPRATTPPVAPSDPVPDLDPAMPDAGILGGDEPMPETAQPGMADAPDDDAAPMGAPAQARGPADEQDLAEFIRVARARVEALDPEGADPARLAALQEDLGNLLDRARPGEGQTYDEVIAGLQDEFRDQLARFDRSERLDDQIEQASSLQAAREAAVAHAAAVDQEIATRNAAHDEANARYMAFRDDLANYVREFRPQWGSAISSSEESMMRQQVVDILMNVPPLPADAVNDVRAREEQLLRTVEDTLRQQRDAQYRARHEEFLRADEQNALAAGQDLNVVGPGNVAMRDAELRDFLNEPLMPPDVADRIRSQLSPQEELYEYAGVSPEDAVADRELQASNAAWAAQQDAEMEERFPTEELATLYGEVANLAQGTLPDGSVDEVALSAAEARYAEAEARYRASHPPEPPAADAAEATDPTLPPPTADGGTPDGGTIEGDDLGSFQQRMHRQIENWQPPAGADPARAEALRGRLHDLVDGAQPTNGLTLEETIEAFTMDMRDEIEDFTNLERAQQASSDQQASAAAVQAVVDRQEATAAEVDIARQAYDTAQSQLDGYRDELRRTVREFQAPGIGDAELQRIRDGALRQIDAWPPIPPDDINDVRSAQMRMLNGVYDTLQTSRDEVYRAQYRAQMDADQATLPAGALGAAFDKRTEELHGLLETPLLSRGAVNSTANALAPQDQQLYEYLGLDPASAADQRTAQANLDASNAAWAAEQDAEMEERFPTEELATLYGEVANLAQGTLPDGSVDHAALDAAQARYAEAEARYQASRAGETTETTEDTEGTEDTADAPPDGAEGAPPTMPSFAAVPDAFDVPDILVGRPTAAAVSSDPDAPDAEPGAAAESSAPPDAFDDPLGVVATETDPTMSTQVVPPPDTSAPSPEMPSDAPTDASEVTMANPMDDDALGLDTVRADVAAVTTQAATDIDDDSVDGGLDDQDDAATDDVPVTAEYEPAAAGDGQYGDAPLEPEPVGYDASSTEYEGSDTDSPPSDDEPEMDDPLFTVDDIQGTLPGT